MKVGVYLGEARPDGGGGYTIVHEIARAVARRTGSAHTFTALTTTDWPTDRASFEGLEVLSLKEALGEDRLPLRLSRRFHRELDRLRGRRSRAIGDIPGRPAVDDLLTRNEIDVVWYLSAWECCTLEIPFFTVVWDLQHRRQPFFPEVSRTGEWEFRERWLSTVLGRAAMVIAGNEVGRDEIERFYGVPRERIRLMPHPTPEPAREADLASAKRVVAGEYIFYPAQFWPHKNHVNLLLALKIVRERHGLDLSLALTGSDKGNLAFVRETARTLGLTEHVSFLGFVSRVELAALYRDALALTYVTFFGPENLPPLEAFAAGCPVVATNVAGAREQMGDAALLVDATKPEEIAAAIARVRDEPELRQRLVEAGARRARVHTSADFVRGVEAWLDEFEGVRRCWPSGASGRD